MKINYESQHKTVDITVSATEGSGYVAPIVHPSQSHIGVNVSFLSTASYVSLAVKPSVLEQEERQVRLSKSIRLGFPPTSASTKG